MWTQDMPVSVCRYCRMHVSSRLMDIHVRCTASVPFECGYSTSEPLIHGVAKNNALANSTGPDRQAKGLYILQSRRCIQR